MTTLTPPTGTAASLVSRNVPVFARTESCGAARERLRGHRFDTARDLPVCDTDGRVVGAVRIEDLLAAADSVPVGHVMDPDPPVLTHDTDEEVAAWHAVRHGESSLIVVDDALRLVGVVPPDRLLDILLHEHEQDVARLGGFLASARSAVHASRESVSRRLLHRLPWLLVGLVGALASAGLMTGLEARARASTVLLLFVPGVIYLADAVGTQTEALVIRGLSIGVPIREIAVRELLTGAVAGTILGLLFLPVGLLVWSDTRAVVTIALTLAAACTTANAVAMLLPALLTRIGLDPAFGSGPLATVCQDLLSIAIYLGIAVLVLA